MHCWTTLNVSSMPCFLTDLSYAVFPLISFWNRNPRCWGRCLRAVWKKMVNKLISFLCSMIAWLSGKSLKVPVIKQSGSNSTRYSNFIFECGRHAGQYKGRVPWCLFSRKYYLSWVPSLTRDKLCHKRLDLMGCSVLIPASNWRAFKLAAVIESTTNNPPRIPLPPTSCLIPSLARTGINLIKINNIFWLGSVSIDNSSLGRLNVECVFVSHKFIEQLYYVAV